MFHSIGFIGTGNMGSAVAAAVVKSGRCEQVILANKTREKAEKVAGELREYLQSGLCKEACGNNEKSMRDSSESRGDVRVLTTTNREIAATCDLIFLGVKPQMMAGMLEDIQEELASRRERVVLCTMAAGLTCTKISELAKNSKNVDEEVKMQQYPVLRIMPNTPAGIGHGVIQYCGEKVTEEELFELEMLLTPAGRVVRVEERLIDAASAVSGCGPAFAYMFAEALADGGVACGLPRKQAMEFAAGMLEGAAALLLESSKHPGELKDAVCSPGGATIQGVRKLEENGFRGAVMDAVIAAYEKTRSLG